MLKLSTALREGLATTGDLKSLLDGGLIKIYSGAVPASADAAIGGAALLCEVSAGGTGTPLTFEDAAPNGVLVKSVAQNWTGNNLAGGTPTFFRYVKAADAGDSSATAVRIQGTVGNVGADMVITELPLVSGEPQTFDLFRLAFPEQ